MITVKRVYEPPTPEDGTRFLVERLWPRGIKKASLQLDAWLKDVAPSAALRRWFGHDPAKWEAFQRRYFAELDDKSETLQPLIEATQRGDVTLLYSARDTAHNNAVALKLYLETPRVHQEHYPCQREDIRPAHQQGAKLSCREGGLDHGDGYTRVALSAHCGKYPGSHHLCRP